MEKNKVGLLHHLIKYHRQNTLKCHVIQCYPIILCSFWFLAQVHLILVTK